MFKWAVTFLLVGSVIAKSKHKEAEFSDDLARNYMLHLAAAAYSDNPGECINHLFKKGEIINFYKVDCRGPLGFSMAISCAAYTAVLHDQKAIVLSFRGTDGGMMQNFKEAAHSYLTKDWFGGAQVNKYFLSAFRNLWNTTDGAGRTMLKDALSLIENTKYKDYKIWITGHSLGGAMASLAAYYLLQLEAASKWRTYLVTFGQPRTGDRVFAENLNSKIHYAFRVINSNDMVPHIPASFNSFFKKFDYLHHKKEVFYFSPRMDNRSFRQCPNEDDAEYKLRADCSGFLKWGDLDFKFVSHRCYYGKYISEWGIHGCVATDKYRELLEKNCK